VCATKETPTWERSCRTPVFFLDGKIERLVESLLKTQCKDGLGDNVGRKSFAGRRKQRYAKDEASDLR